MGILEKIGEIEREIARTQKNKGNRDGLTHVVEEGMVLINAHSMQPPSTTWAS